MHETRLAQLRATQFVNDDTLIFQAYPGELQIRGDIGCRGSIVVSVCKVLHVIDSGDIADPFVQTFEYSYNASVRGYREFLRYDNAHPHPGHADHHHRHDLDWRTGAPLAGSPTWIGASGWPTLGTFLEQVETWYWEHRDQLPDPDGYPVLTPLRGT